MSESKSVGLTAEKLREIRRLADEDVFYFGKVICGHKDLVLVDHGPLMYAAAGCADKLVALLTSPSHDSYTIRQMRKEFFRLGIDLAAADAIPRVEQALRVIDIRVYRGAGKSSSVTHPVRLWKMCRDPNLSSVLITNTEPKAVDFCKQIRATILSDRFAAVYPDRVPADPKGMLTESKLTVGGRTTPDKEPCLMVFGYKQSPTGYHFDEFHFDDLVGKENRSLVDIADVRDFLSGVPSLYNPSLRVPIRRIHVGTRWDERDDCDYVRQYKKCFAVTIPIWHREAPVDDLTTPGIPTTQWKPLAKIYELQEEVLSNKDEGTLSWRCNQELDPAIAGGRLFSAEMLNDLERYYIRVPHPKQERHAKGHYLVARSKRKEGAVVVKEGWTGAPDDPRRIEKLILDPWRDLDRVLTLDPCWKEGGDNWAVSCTGDDSEGIRYQLETQSGDDGIDGWVDALIEMIEFWQPRIVGYDGNGTQDGSIQDKLRLDRRLLKYRSRFVPVKGNSQSKNAKIRSFVAIPLQHYRLLLDPRSEATRKEMLNYRGDKNAVDGILDSLAMSQAVHIRKTSAKSQEEIMERLRARDRELDRFINPYTGQAYAA